MPYDRKVSLKVYDMTGREVLTLVNDFKMFTGYPPGTFPKAKK